MRDKYVIMEYTNIANITICLEDKDDQRELKREREKKKNKRNSKNNKNNRKYKLINNIINIWLNKWLLQKVQQLRIPHNHKYCHMKNYKHFNSCNRLRIKHFKKLIHDTINRIFFKWLKIYLSKQ